VSIHRREPTTERHGGFDLLRLRPGPMNPSLDDLVVPGSPRSTISILVRTPDRHIPLQLRAAELLRSTNLSLPVAWITGARHCTRRRRMDAASSALDWSVCDVIQVDVTETFSPRLLSSIFRLLPLYFYFVPLYIYSVYI